MSYPRRPVTRTSTRGGLSSAARRTGVAGSTAEWSRLATIYDALAIECGAVDPSFVILDDQGYSSRSSIQGITTLGAAQIGKTLSELDPSDKDDLVSLGVLHGQFWHELGHIKYGVPDRCWDWIIDLSQTHICWLLEEGRVESKTFWEFEQAKTWLRLAFRATSPIDNLEIPSGLALSLSVLVRWVAGVFDEAEITDILKAVEGQLGEERFQQLLQEIRSVIDLDASKARVEIPACAERIVGLLRRAAPGVAVVVVIGPPDSGLEGEDPDGGGGSPGGEPSGDGGGEPGSGVQPDDGAPGESGGGEPGGGDSSSPGGFGGGPSASGDPDLGFELGLDIPDLAADAELSERDLTAIASLLGADATDAGGSGDAGGRGVVGAGVVGKSPGRMAVEYDERLPTLGERTLRRKFAAELRRVTYRGRSSVVTPSFVPPGRLVSRRLIQAEAVASRGGVASVPIWRAKKRREAPAPPLQLVVLADISGSMNWLQGEASGLVWASVGAVQDVGGQAAALAFGDRVATIYSPGYPTPKVADLVAVAGTEYVGEGAAQAEAIFGQFRFDPSARRLLLVLSDGQFTDSSQALEYSVVLNRLQQQGVLCVQMNMSAEPIPHNEDAQITLSESLDLPRLMVEVFGQAWA